MGQALDISHSLLDRVAAAIGARAWRAILGLVLFAVLPACGFALSGLMLKDHMDDERRRLDLLAETATVFIERDIEGRIRPMLALQRLVGSQSGDGREAFASAATSMRSAQPGFTLFSLIGADRSILLTVPEVPGAVAIGQRLGDFPAVAAILDQVERTGLPAATDRVAPLHDGSGVAGYFPLTRNGQPAGFVSVVIDLDLIVREAQLRLDPTLQVSVVHAADQERPAPDSRQRVERSLSILGRPTIVEVSLPRNTAHTAVITLQIALAILFFAATGALLLLADRLRAASERERQRLKDAVDALPFGFAIAGGDERVIAVNSGLRDMFPDLRDMLVPGTRIEDLARRFAQTSREGAAVEESVTRQMARARQGQTDEYMPIGEDRWHRIIERRTSEGGIAHIQIDVSELQRARRDAEDRARQLATSEERYQRLVEASGVITWSIGAQGGGFASLEGACDAITGYPHPERLDFAFWLDRAHADDRALLAALFAQPFDAAREIDARFRVSAADGRLVWLHMKGTVIDAPEGRIKGGLMIDMTAQKEAEDAQASAQAMLASAIENLGDWVALYDPDDRLLSANASYSRARTSAPYGAVIARGERYEDIIRGVVAAGMVQDAKGREEAWIAERLASHRSAVAPTELRLADGRWFLIRDHRLADGSTIVISTDITALKEATAAAERERMRLRDAIESLPASFLMFDADERLVIANQRGFDRFQLDPSTALGKSAEEIVRIAVRQGLMGSGADEQDLVEERLARFRRSAGITEYRSPDGRWWQVIDRPTQDGGRIALRLELTETKEAQAELAELHRRFQAILDNAPMAIFMKDRDDRYVLTNRRFDAWYLDEGQSAIGMTTRELRPASRATQIAEINSDILASGAPIERELDYIGPAQGISHVLLNSFPVLDEQEEVIGIAGFVSDISARRQSETRRAWAENELRAVMDNAVDGLITIDESGEIVTFSKPAERIFGYRAEEVTGKNVSLLMPPAERSNHDRYLAAFMAGGPPKIIGTGREVTAMRKDGSVFPVDLAVGEIPSAGGPRRFVGTLRDITGRKEMERRLEHSQRVETLGRLTSGVAHDFNNVLAAIALNLEMLAPALEGDAESRQWLETATRAAHRGKSLTRQLLAVAGRQTLKPGRLLVRTVFEEARRLLETSLGSKHNLRISLEDDALALHADAGNLESALLNLVLNARDASAEGGDITLVAQAVRIEPDGAAPSPGLQPGAYVRIDVCDTGVGMSPELKARAAEPFYTTKEMGKGSGLGLSMVTGFAQQSGGAVTIDSEVGLGTVVSLYLPVAEPEGHAAVVPREAEAPAGLRGRRILMVEDEDMIRQTLAQQLRRAGFVVLSAASADEALALAGSHPDFDLLLSDIKMPGGKTGLALAQALRERRPDLPVLLMSGYIGDELALEEVARLGVEVLKKPFRNLDLLDAVERTIKAPT